MTTFGRRTTEKWTEVLNRFLVDEATMKAINGGRYYCSGEMLG